MSTKWLAIQSFQYDRNLIAAINTLSIHLKLELAGISNVEKAKEVYEARNTLSSFLEKIELETFFRLRFWQCSNRSEFAR